MLSPVTRLDFDDYTELIPAALTIILISFTYNFHYRELGGIYRCPSIFLRLIG